MNVPPAHAADADHGAGQHRQVKRLGAAAVILRGPALQDRHQPIDDAKVGRALPALPIGGNRAADAIEDLVTVVRDLVFTAIIGRGDSSERIAGGQRHVVGDRPWEASIPVGQHIAGTVQIEAAQASGIRELAVPPALPIAPAAPVAPFRQAVG